MQNCMKATVNQLESLRKRIATARAADSSSDAAIGDISGVHPSQVGRICRGEFKTISHNVVQVCKALGLKIESAALREVGDDLAWLKLESSLRKLWDETPEGADRIARVLDTIGALRAG